MDRISVLISIYYKENPVFFRAALMSLINQSLRPDEIVLVKDGPLTHDLDIVIEEFSVICNFLKIIVLENNQGLSYALNTGLIHCKYEYVARMDTDDICSHDRFEKQINYLIKNPEIDIVGSFSTKIDEMANEIGIIKVPTSNSQIYKLLWACPIIHPSVMFKKSRILSVGSYNHDAGPRQDDYDLWFRCAEAGLKFSNIPEILLYYRFSKDTIQKNTLNVGWHRFKVGLKWSRRLNLGLIAYLGITIPLIRALLPYPLNIYFYKFLQRVDPRSK